MIYTVTLNPALDYVMKTSNFTTGITNRSEEEKIFFGGKGINVSFVLKELGEESTALGFIAGFTGDELEREVRKNGIKSDFIRLDSGYTRINVKLKGNAETEINALGPRINQGDIGNLYKKLDCLQKGDTLVLSGSVPRSCDEDIYEKILCRQNGKGIRFCIDAEGQLLLNSLKYEPFLIKPNKHELEEIAGKKLTTDIEIEAAARELKNRGAVNVLVSLGGEGALLLDEFRKTHRCKAPRGKAVNTVGAGDSMVAGFIAGVKKDYDYALRLGSAAGTATAFSMSLAKKEDILSLL